jgi:hypothetical protein
VVMHALEQTGYADDTVVSFWGDREFSDGCIFSDRASDINAYSVELTHVWCFGLVAQTAGSLVRRIVPLPTHTVQHLSVSVSLQSAQSNC